MDDDDGEDSAAVGAEEARRAVVLRPLVQACLNGTGSLESGINDAVWELGVSRATVWRWIKRLAEEGGAPALWYRGSGAARQVGF
ncbi:helix-turn-helix domain-containing protein [Paracoccus seriniphilus]|uniref:helix-turn-helix domain-containing protein n=1 Tax=Paracoccus seriniphilus TaxID=184748 RepID=UPI001FE88C07|nr:helix-turn-helix domain-containing protein [Paracoccus seriniphilus]